jgi:putative PIN family toxin of toxin-antitoxin system
MRVVLDTNVLISALAFPGSKPDQVLQRIRQGEVALFISAFILAELERILRDKFRFTTRQTDERVAVIRRMATLVEPTERIALVVAKDDDNRILECVVAARADYLVTGDKEHLLPLRSIGATQIVTPAAFLELGLG